MATARRHSDSLVRGRVVISAGYAFAGLFHPASGQVAEVPPEAQALVWPATLNRCGANSVFLVSTLFGEAVPYSLCLYLLPPRDTGNTMLEVKEALERLGFSVTARSLGARELSRVKETCVAWLPSAIEVRTPSGDRYRLGHFFVIRPVGDGLWRVMDFPDRAETVNIQAWAAEQMAAHHLEDIPVLLVKGLTRRGGPEDRRSNERPKEGPIHPSDVESATHAPDAQSILPPATAASDRLHIELAGATPDMLQGTIDFGDRLQGEDVAGTISIGNRLPYPVRITSVRSTCSCTAVYRGENLAQPGESLSLPISMDLRGRVGRVVETVSFAIETPHGAIPVVVQANANAWPQWIVEPAAATFGRVSNGAEPPARVLDVSAAFPDLAARLRSVVSRHPAFRGEVSSLDDDARRYEVRIMLNPSVAGPGVIATSLGVVGEGHDGWELSIPVTAEISPSVRVRPGRLLLKRASGYTASVQISLDDSSPLRFIGARSLTSRVSASFSHVSDDQRVPAAAAVSLSVRCQPPERDLVHDVHELTFECRDGRVYKVELPITLSAS